MYRAADAAVLIYIKHASIESACTVTRGGERKKKPAAKGGLKTVRA
jgi:hypothetical protein